MGLLNPSSGEINIENLPLNKIKNSWQKKIGCVAQETFISDESLKKNIAFGVEENQINEKKVKEVLQITNLENFEKI